ncbi:MAG: DUF255 domain-containing protein, partial [Candidatus Latescibacteria bacterium]|nr:DUF255 domain-containing protein [Candidatus Latescibacterota bacterium]
MNERTLIDELRALLAGTLPFEEEERLRERCATDPELRALLDELAEVHALTAPVAEETPPPCRLTFLEMEGTLVPQRAGRMVLRRAWRVAAAVLVFVVGGFVLSRAFIDREDGAGDDTAVAPAPGPASDRTSGGEAGRQPLVLAAIPPEEPAEPDPGPRIPEVLATYRPVKDGAIQWIDTFAEAAAMARVSSRPVLLFLHYETCPWCIEMREGALSDPEVVARFEAFVPAAIDCADPPEDVRPLLRRLFETKGWPWFGAVDVDGDVILTFPGRQDSEAFLGRLEEAAKLVAPPVIDWDEANRFARRLLKARESEAERDFGASFRGYREVLAEEAAAPFHPAAVAGKTRIAAAARAALLSARRLALAGAGTDT